MQREQKMKKMQLIITAIIASLLLASCMESKDRIPKRFLDNGKSLSIFIVDEHHLEKILILDGSISFAIGNAKRDERREVLVYAYDFGGKQYRRIKEWQWEEHEDIREELRRKNSLVGEELLERFGEDILIWGYEPVRPGLSIMGQYPGVMMDLEYIGELDDVLDIVNKHYKIVEVY